MKKKECKYYPCHNMKDMDCSMCYCPIYPCEEEKLGGKWTKGVWDCSGCIVPHDTVIAWNIKTLIHNFINSYYRGKNE